MSPDVEDVGGEVVGRPPRARCLECGDEEVTALCCNCAAFLCGRHDRIADLREIRHKAENLLRRAGYARGDDPAVLGRLREAGEDPTRPVVEPAGPRAQAAAEARVDAQAEPKSVMRRHFCAECVPVGHAVDVHIIGALASAVLGLAVMPFTSALGVLVVVAAGCWAGVRVGTGLVRRRRRGRNDRRSLFLAPRIRRVELTETVVGRCELDPDRQQSLVVDEVRAALEVGLRWTGSHAAAAERHRRTVRPERRRNLRAEAGYLVLRGASQLDMTHPSGCEIGHPARVALRPWLNDHDVLSHPDGRGDARWDFTLAYRPGQPAGGWRLPVWVTPSITPDSDRRSLELRVQWRTVDPISDPDDGPELTATELTSVVLNVPSAWGAVQHVSLDDVEQTLVGDPQDGSTRIQWKKPGIARTSRGSRDLSVSFARPVDPSATVTGDLEISFDRAASGITGVQVHAPGGGRRRDGARPRIRTTMRVRFELSLAGIRYQESRTVPDAALDPGTTTETHTFLQTRPDQHLIVGLVRQLAEQRYLVKSVVEHPTRPGSGVGLQYRVWDVTGRRYRGAHPIDFRIAVTGDEAEAGATSPSSTSIRLIVRAVHASTDTEQEIVQAYEDIWARINTAVGAAETGADGNLPRLQSEPIAAIGTHAAHLQGTLLSIESMLGEAEREGRISTDLAGQIHEVLELGRVGGA
ncbi:MAG TPA: hypothetical protein VEZ42_02275 [Pseudonocardia sp.]|nr:hypothetical protein [Pseudonocardia sp.]